MQTAWREAQQRFTTKAQPTMVCAYRVDCEDVLDLTMPQGRRDAGVADEDLSVGWEFMAARGEEPPTWAMARRLIVRGVALVIVPSFAPGAGADDRNAVFWRWSDAPPHRVAVVDDGRLPRDGRSWR